MAPINTIKLLAQTLAMVISRGTRGMTSKCSTVPRSFSLMRAAAGRIMERSVIMWVSNTKHMNQEFSLFGLYITRVFT